MQQAGAWLSGTVPARTVQTLDEAKGLRDRAQALAYWAKQQGHSQAVQNEAAEVKHRAERKAGELLAASPKHPGSRNGWSHSGTAEKLADLGITKNASSRWQQVAALPDDAFEEYLEESKAANDELTTGGGDGP